MSISPRGAMRVLAPAILLALALGGHTMEARAQHLRERTFAVVPPNASAQPQIWAAERPRAWPYVLTGAIVGAAALGVGLAVYYEDTNEAAIMSPFSLLPAFAGCAAVGGGLGYVVYRIRL